MKKRIKVCDLKIDMHLLELDGNWLKNPLLRSNFTISDLTELKILQNSGIDYAWINSTDAGNLKPTTDEKMAGKLLSKEKLTTPKKTTLKDELQFSKAVVNRAQEAITNMFHDARMGNSVNVSEAVPLVDEITMSVSRNPGAILSLTRLKNKDNYTYLHSVAVCALMIALGKQLDYQGNLQTLGIAGMFHDIGKMGVPEDLLNKPGKLSDEEFKVIQSHPYCGWEMLKEHFDADEITLDVCLHHHERIDGKGYPEKLSDNDISIEAKMAAVCDVYDAITSNRSYKKAWEPTESLRKMAEWKSGHFDDTIFNAFIKTVGIYPTGTLVKLKSGRLAVVTEQSSKSLLTPVIKVFYSCSSRAQIPIKEIKLSQSQEAIESVEQPETWGFDRAKIMDVL